MENLLIIPLVVVAYFAFRFAVRQHRRLRADPYVRMLQSAGLSYCSDVMANDEVNASTRRSSGGLAMMIMSEPTLWEFGSKPSVRAAISRNESGNQPESIDRELLAPAVEMFAMAAMIYDPHEGDKIREDLSKRIAAAYAEFAYIDQTKTKPQNRSRRSPPPDPVAQVEPLVERELRDWCLN